MLGNEPSVSLVPSYSVLVRQLPGVRSTYYYPHFTGEDIETQRLSNRTRPTAKELQNCHWTQDCLPPELVLSFLSSRFSCLSWSGSPHHSFSVFLHAEIPREFTTLLVLGISKQGLSLTKRVPQMCESWSSH